MAEVHLGFHEVAPDRQGLPVDQVVVAGNLAAEFLEACTGRHQVDGHLGFFRILFLVAGIRDEAVVAGQGAEDVAVQVRTQVGREGLLVNASLNAVQLVVLEGVRPEDVTAGLQQHEAHLVREGRLADVQHQPSVAPVFKQFAR